MGATFVAVSAQAFRLLLATLGADGRDFERLCKWYLENDPVSKARFRRVWLWDEWPGRWGRDRGIDLVAETVDGRNVAVQAKNYGERHSITKRDIDTFLSESSRPVIAERLLMASTDRVAASAREVMLAQDKPVSTCLLAPMSRSPVRWPVTIDELLPDVISRAEPRPHQVRVLEDIDRWARTDAPRGQVVMACGTGKSLIAIWAADRLGAPRVLVLGPTLALLRQVAREWSQHASVQRQLLYISSDTSRLGEDVTRGDELATHRTTDADHIADRLRSASQLLVLCTYNSSPALALAMTKAPEVEFDLAIADEAHRCAGLEGSSHKTILDATAIRAIRRLFFTATPTVYGTKDRARAARRNIRLSSMDDPALFGTVIHHLSFAEAIRQNLLCPYQVAVIPINDAEVMELVERRRIVTADGDHKLEAGSLATQVACARAMRRFGCRRVVAFHPRIKDSQRFGVHFPIAAGLLSDEERPDGPIWSQHIDGRDMPHARRVQLLEQFESDDDQYRLLSNVRLLTEGVNVPGIDAIAFVDTHRGQAQIIQAVGRAVRLAPGKSVGTIVLPVVLREGESFEAALARSDHRTVVDVLGALRSHDPEIMKSLDGLRFDANSDDGPPSVATGRFVIDAALEVGEEFAEAVDIALTNALGLPSRRPASGSGALAQIRVIDERPPPSEEEMFLRGLHELQLLARWRLVPCVPATSHSFPMGVWWQEAKRRWLADELDEYDRSTIADAVSWLAPDLERSRLRRALAEASQHDLPEQIEAQLRPGGVLHVTHAIRLLEEDQDPEAVVDATGSIQGAITHPAMSHEMQLRYVRAALDLLSEATERAAETPEPPIWRWTTQRAVAIAAFAHTLGMARAGTSPYDRPHPPGSLDACPEAAALGHAAGLRFAKLAHRMRAYRFPGDVDAVRDRRLLERSLSPDARLDALGWDIYMLSRHVGADNNDALLLAMDGTYRAREKVRADRLARALRQIAMDDSSYLPPGAPSANRLR